jgi:hypothetical protein
MIKDDHARRFYETEALRGGWSVRQLDWQIGSQFYERTALSKNKAAMLVKGTVPEPEDAVMPDDAIKVPYVLEFLDLKDEHSESDLKQALIRRLDPGPKPRSRRRRWLRRIRKPTPWTPPLWPILSTTYDVCVCDSPTEYACQKSLHDRNLHLSYYANKEPQGIGFHGRKGNSVAKRC